MLKTLNLLIYIIGFLIINFINFIVGENLIGSQQFRIFQVVLSILVLLQFMINKPMFLLQIVRSRLFIMYIFFSILYLIKIAIDLFIFELTTESVSPIIDLFISFSFIFLIPISLVSIRTINILVVNEIIYYFLSVILILRVIITPFNEIGVFQRFSGFENMGVQSIGFYASILFTWSVIRFINMNKWNLVKLFNFPMIFLGLYFLALSGTRSTISSSLIIILLFLFINRQKINKRIFFSLVLFISISIVLTPYWEHWLSLLTNRFERGFESGNITGRGDIYPIAFEMFLTSPIIGNHHIIPPKGPWFHNYILDAFVTTGLLGGFFYLILNIKLIKASLNWLKTDKNAEYQFYAIAFLLSFLYGMFIGNLYTAQFYWGFLIIMMALIHKKK